MNRSFHSLAIACMFSLTVACQDNLVRPENATDIGSVSMSEDEQPVVRIVVPNEPGQGEPAAEIVRLGDLPTEVQDRVRELPIGVSAAAQHRRILESYRVLDVAVVDAPLQSGVLAIVRLGARSPIDGYVLVSASTLDDEILDRAHGVAAAYLREHPEDVGPVSISLFEDGRFVRDSELLGRYAGVQQFQGFYRNKQRRSAAILRAAREIEPTWLPGAEAARVVRLNQRS